MNDEEILEKECDCQGPVDDDGLTWHTEKCTKSLMAKAREDEQFKFGAEVMAKHLEELKGQKLVIGLQQEEHEKLVEQARQKARQEMAEEYPCPAECKAEWTEKIRREERERIFKELEQEVKDTLAVMQNHYEATVKSPLKDWKHTGGWCEDTLKTLEGKLKAKLMEDKE